MKNFDKPPFTNRGAQMTTPQENQGFVKIEKLKLEQRICIDWCQFTIFDKFGYTVYDYFYNFFGIKREDVIFEKKGLFSYSYTYSYNNIKIFTSDNAEYGYHVYLTGQACREFEELAYKYNSETSSNCWYRLFNRALSYDANFTRIDVAIDDFSGKFFTLDNLISCLHNGEVSSKFKEIRDFKSIKIEGCEILGRTLWFGSRASRLQVVFYDKLLERESQNYIVDNDIDFWLRCEMRFRVERANEIVKKYVSDSNNFSDLIKGVLDYYVSFVDYSATDSRKSRWKRKDWWDRYLESVDKSRLTSIPIETSITKKKLWIDNSVSRSEFSVLLSTIDNIDIDDKVSNYFYDLLKSGYTRFEEKDLQMVNEERITKKLAPITMEQIEDFIKDLKSVIISNKG